MKRNRLGMLGLAIITVLVLSAFMAPVISPYDPLEPDLPSMRAPPSRLHPLGRDEFGRDILARLLFGSRIAMLVGVVSVSVGLITGTVLGLVAGFYGGALDEVIMRIMDIFLAFPYLLLAVAIVGALGPGLVNTMIAIGIWTMPTYARLVRGSVLAVKEKDFVEAARAMGGGVLRLIGVHILPNCLSPLIVHSTLNLARAILMEAALSFLGLGVQPPTPSWGSMISGGRAYLRVAPHLVTFPGLAIMLAVLGFNLLGDGLRDALDPKLKDV